MTVIARFVELQAAVSDVMLSVTHEDGTEFQSCWLPSAGYVKGLPSTPTRLVRKIVEVRFRDRRGTFLYAGTVKHVEAFVGYVDKLNSGKLALLSYYENPPDEIAALQTARDMAISAGFNDFSLIGFLGDHPFIHTVNDPPEIPELPYFGSCLLMGSGGPQLSSWLAKRGEKWMGNIDQSAGARKTHALHTTASMLLEEDSREGRGTLELGVGGYYGTYEVAGGIMTPSDNVLTVFAAIIEKRGDWHIELRRFFIHTYRNEWLLVGSLTGLPLKLRPGQSVRLPLSQLECTAIEPTISESYLKPKWTPELLALTAQHPKHLRLSLYHQCEGSDYALMRFYKHDANPPLVRLRSEGGYITLKLDDEGVPFYRSRFSRPAEQPTDTNLVGSEERLAFLKGRAEEEKGSGASGA